MSQQAFSMLQTNTTQPQFTGTPAGVGPVSIGQHLQGYLEGEKLLDFYIR